MKGRMKSQKNFVVGPQFEDSEICLSDGERDEGTSTAVVRVLPNDYVTTADYSNNLF
jgi:hypothetical protein